MGRRSIMAPNGCSYVGRLPDVIGQAGEGPYIAELARTVNGLCEVVLPVGRADAASKQDVFEVEPASSWRSGARQVLAYAGQTGWRPALALFGPADYLRIYLFLRDRLPGIALWVWRGHWERTTSRQKAMIKHAPLIDPSTPQRQADRVPGEDRWLRQVRNNFPDVDGRTARRMAEASRKAQMADLARRSVVARAARRGGAA